MFAVLSCRVFPSSKTNSQIKKAKWDAGNTGDGKRDKTADDDDDDDDEQEDEEEASAIGDPSLTAHAAGNLAEDLTWRKRLESVTGPAYQDSKSPSEREGPLWEMYRKAVSEGFEVDTSTYYTMLRIKVGASGEDGVGGSSGGASQSVARSLHTVFLPSFNEPNAHSTSNYLGNL